MNLSRDIVSIGGLIIFTGCVTLYKPNVNHSPLVKEKGEMNTAASIGLSGCGLYNFEVAYAVSDHVGIMLNVMDHYRKMEDTDSSFEKINMFIGEAGAGYFTRIGSNKMGLFQCYGGGGYGITTDKMHNTYFSNPELSANYYNIYIQPGWAIFGEHHVFAIDLKANYVRLYNIHAYLYDKFEWWNTDLKFYSDTSLYFVNLEPTLTLKVGSEKIKGMIQLGFIIPTIHSNSFFHVNTSSLIGTPLIKFSLGITYSIRRKG